MMREDLVEIDAWVRDWARWFRADHAEIERMTGFPKSSAGFWSGGSSSVDSFDEMVEAEDQKVVHDIDRCIRGLTPQHYAAICNHYLASVARHRGDPAEVLVAALLAIKSSARRV